MIGLHGAFQESSGKRHSRGNDQGEIVGRLRRIPDLRPASPTVLPFPARKGWILPRLVRLHLGEEEPHALIVRRIEPEHPIKDLLCLRDHLDPVGFSTRAVGNKAGYKTRDAAA